MHRLQSAAVQSVRRHPAVVSSSRKEDVTETGVTKMPHKPHSFNYPILSP